MIYDTFTYFKETDVVKFRFHELFDTIDKFVAIESSQTFRGDRKPFYGDDFFPTLPKEWQEKLIRIKIDFPEELVDPWDREAYQRNALRNIWYEPDDIIIISDADEICRASTLKEHLPRLQEDPFYFDNTLYYINFNLRVPQAHNGGGRPVALRYQYMTETPYIHRFRCPLYFGGIMIPNGGWHFSYFGGIEAIQEKISSFSHSEYDKDEFKNRQHLEHCNTHAQDIFKRFPLEVVNVDDTYPIWIQQNQDDLRHFMR